jgi:hypothetical protein
LALLVPHIPKEAQNGNQDAIQVYSIFRQVPVTGLIEAFLIKFFRILNVRAQKQKYTILTGGKPALLFPIGRRICFGIIHIYRLVKRTSFFRIRNPLDKTGLPAITGVHHSLTLGEPTLSSAGSSSTSSTRQPLQLLSACSSPGSREQTRHGLS